MKFTLNHFIYMAIILLSIFLIFPKIIEGNTCSKREYIDDFTTCSDGMPNTLSYTQRISNKMYTVFCDDNNRPYYNKY